MQKSILFALVGITMCVSVIAADSPIIVKLGKELDAKSGVDAKVKSFVKEKLFPICSNEKLVSETKAQNAKKVSMDKIRKTDKAWMAIKQFPLKKELMNNACAEELKKICAANPVIDEVFVMDNQGAVVGENKATSDYWQGDEKKWLKSYNNAQGGVDISQVKMDKSAKQVLQQVSLPLIDSDGKIIGAITFGLAIKKM